MNTYRVWGLIIIHSSFVRNVWISAMRRVTSHPFSYTHVLTLLTSNLLLSMIKPRLLGYSILSHLSTRSWQSSIEQPSSFKYSLNFYISGSEGLLLMKIYNLQHYQFFYLLFYNYIVRIAFILVINHLYCSKYFFI